MKKSVIFIKARLQKFLNDGQAAHQKNSDAVEFLEQVKQAHKEWQVAINNFNNFSDPDMIDYAVYNVDAAEKKFIYLLKKAQKDNFCANQSFNTFSTK